MWGKSNPKPLPKSSFSKVFPLLILLVVTSVIAFVIYHFYVTAKHISTATNEKMRHKNVMISRDGVKIGVKDLGNESYVDKTQSYLVKAWNLSAPSDYSSRFRIQSSSSDRKQSNGYLRDGKSSPPFYSRSSISK